MCSQLGTPTDGRSRRSNAISQTGQLRKNYETRPRWMPEETVTYVGADEDMTLETRLDIAKRAKRRLGQEESPPSAPWRRSRCNQRDLDPAALRPGHNSRKFTLSCGKATKVAGGRPKRRVSEQLSACSAMPGRLATFRPRCLARRTHGETRRPRQGRTATSSSAHCQGERAAGRTSSEARPRVRRGTA